MVPSPTKDGNWSTVAQFAHLDICRCATATLGMIDTMASSFTGAKVGASVWAAVVI